MGLLETTVLGHGVCVKLIQIDSGTEKFFTYRPRGPVTDLCGCCAASQGTLRFYRPA